MSDFEDVERVECDICGKEVSVDAVKIVCKGEIALYVCEACLMESFNINQCDKCYDWFFIDDLIYVEEEDKYYCEDCYSRKS